jgi:hypothetical protein
MEEKFGDDKVALDRDKADEALLIAARLQHEHSERSTLAEMKRTAAEADISPEFVDQAILMLGEPLPKTRGITLRDVLAVPPLVALQCFVTLMVVWGSLNLPACLLVVVVAGTIGFLADRSSRNRNRALVGSLCVVVLLCLACFAARHDFERVHILWGGGFALALELASYFGVQFVRGKMGSGRAPGSSDVDQLVDGGASATH